MSLKESLRHLWADRRRVGFWWVVGVGFTLLNIPVLYLLVDLLTIPLGAATLIAGEAGLLARFLVNDRWVFGQLRPTPRQLWQYHVAAAGGFAIWWVATNILSRIGMHYLVAALAATGASVMWSMVTNFLWVWRHRSSDRPALAEPPANN